MSATSRGSRHFRKANARAVLNVFKGRRRGGKRVFFCGRAGREFICCSGASDKRRKKIAAPPRRQMRVDCRAVMHEWLRKGGSGWVMCRGLDKWVWDGACKSSTSTQHSVCYHLRFLRSSVSDTTLSKSPLRAKPTVRRRTKCRLPKPCIDHEQRGGNKLQKNKHHSPAGLLQKNYAKNCSKCIIKLQLSISDQFKSSKYMLTKVRECPVPTLRFTYSPVFFKNRQVHYFWLISYLFL